MVLNVVRFLKPRIRLVLTLLVCGFLARYYLPIPSTWSQTSEYGYNGISPAGNETLGFGAIFALTIDDNTWRTQGLRAAAKAVGLQIRIPIQTKPSDAEAYDYLAGDELTEILNEVKATLNYLALLEAFLGTGYETGLFLEDDADFSIHIRSQLALISAAILEDDTKRHPVDATVDFLQNHFPYVEDSWDVFWIGHFGVEFSADTHPIDYNDPFALPWDRLTSDFNNYYETVRMKKQKKQEIANYVAPMATYGFALTRNTAQMLVQRLRKDRSQKFDLALHILCKGRELRCTAPVPEVVHHHSVVGMETIRLAGEDKGEKEDLSWWRKRHKFTYNVEYSARCNALQAGEKLQDLWQCLPGRYDKNY